MTEKDNSITNVKLEIGGEWYETHVDKEGNGCGKCDLRKWCDENVNLYKLCKHREFHMYFKKATGKSLEDARFIHG